MPSYSMRKKLCEIRWWLYDIPWVFLAAYTGVQILSLAFGFWFFSWFYYHYPQFETSTQFICLLWLVRCAAKSVNDYEAEHTAK